MKCKLVPMFSPSRVGATLGAVVALTASIAWSQIAPPAPPAPAVPATPATPATPAIPDTPAVPAIPATPASPALDNAADAAKDATDTAQDAANKTTDATTKAADSATKTAQDAANSTQDAARDATSTARDAVRGAANTAQDATRGAANTARDAADTTRDAARGTSEAVRDTARDVRENTRDVRGTARDAARDVRDTARDVREDVRETTRDTARDLRQTTREATRDLRGSASASASASANLRSADLGLWFDRSATNGLIIADVAADAALGRIGFREGDRIVSVGGQTVASETEFIRYLSNNNVRRPLDVVVVRDGQQQILNVDPTVIRAYSSTSARIDPLEQFGVILDDRVSDRLVVWRVIPRSPAFYAGIRAGDVITTFAGQRMTSPDGFVQIVQRTDSGLVPIEVMRNGRSRVIQADFADMQVYTSARQNLDVNAADADANVRSGLRANLRSDGTQADIQAQGQIDANADLPADAAPALNATERSSPGYYNNSNNYGPRRGVFRRRR